VFGCTFQSSDVRTVIKTPGIRWTQEHGLQQQRWAHFSVDDKHHLLSVLSRLSPSPDWCVGVSALDLCVDNCTWLADTTVRLYAWDAGVSNSDSYTSEYRRGGPVQPIHHLPDHVHDNPGLPFRSDTSTEPMALLRLQRFDSQPGDDAACSQTRAKEQRVTKVNYPAADTDHLHQNSCVMGSWSEWNKCSATCGTGVRTRTRTAIVMTDMCPELQQTVSEPCKTADCVGQCTLHSWSEWSACNDGFLLCLPGSNDVGSCSRRRSRFFRQPGAEAFCNQTVEEEEPCRPSVTRIVASFDADMMSKCFSPADIGPCKGNFLRWYYDPDSSGCQTFLYGGCRGNANRYATEEDCMRACRQYAVNASQRNTDDGFQTDIGTMTSSKSSLTGISNTTKDVAFDAKSDRSMAITPTLAVDCLMSPWSKWSDCSVTCGRHGVRMRSRTTRRPPSGGGKKCPRRKFRRRKCSMPACSETSQCQYTEWSLWSACARSCGHDTVQERIQRVQASLSQRSQCPVKLQRRLCSLPRCTVN